MAKQTALIVDDEVDIRELISITLSRMGLETVTASDLSEAHEELGEHAFDLCLTDMRLPDGNGLDLVKHILRLRHKIFILSILILDFFFYYYF